MHRTVPALSVLLALVGCSTPLPNSAGLSVSGSNGIPVFTWTGLSQEELDVVDWRAGSSGIVLWRITAAGGPPVCVNQLNSPVTYREIPNGLELEGEPSDVPVTVPVGDDYEASVSRCVSKDQEAGGRFEVSHVAFRVLDDGAIEQQ